MLRSILSVSGTFAYLPENEASGRLTSIENLLVVAMREAKEEFKLFIFHGLDCLWVARKPLDSEMAWKCELHSLFRQT